MLKKTEGLSGVEFRRVPDPSGDSGIEIYLCLRDAQTADAFRAQLQEMNVPCHKTTGTYCHFAQEYCRLAGAHAPPVSPFGKFDQWPAQGYRAEDFPCTNALVERFVALPLGVLFSEEDADYIADCVCLAHAELGIR